MKRTIKDWLVILVLLLDEAVVVAVVFLVLWALGVKIPLWITIVTALLLGAIVFVTHKVIIPALRRKKVTGSEGMVGLEGTVIEPLAPMGLIMVGGEYWKARSAGENLAVGEEVEILELKGLILKVKLKNGRLDEDSFKTP